MELGDAAHHLPRDADHDGCVEPAATHIADRDEHPPIGEMNGIIPIAANLSGTQAGFVERVERAARDIRECEREDGALERGRRAAEDGGAAWA